MKLKLPQRRIWRVAIYIVSLVLVLAAVDLIMVQARRRIAHGFQTTRIMAPLLPDGRIDYLVAIDQCYGQGITPDNNAAVPILQALGPAAMASNQPRDGITARLGMPNLPEKGD